MKSYGENLTHQREVQKVLISLSKVYDPICVVIERTFDLNIVTGMGKIPTCIGNRGYQSI